jgi:hypothetical protein
MPNTVSRVIRIRPVPVVVAPVIVPEFGGAVCMDATVHVPLALPVTIVDGGDGGDSSPRVVTYVYTYERDSVGAAPPATVTPAAVEGAETPKANHAVGYGVALIAAV